MLPLAPDLHHVLVFLREWLQSRLDLSWSKVLLCNKALQGTLGAGLIREGSITHTQWVTLPLSLSLSFLSAYFSCLAHPLKCFLSSFHFFLHNNNSVIEIGCITHCVMHYCMYVLCNARWYMWLYCLAFRSLCVSSNALASATLRASSSDVFRLLMSLTHANWTKEMLKTETPGLTHQISEVS